ncbi:hypothetical protein [Rhodococcus sp. NPDC003348]
MQELDCRTCGNPVLVETYSPTHTSVQWLEDASVRCAEFRALAQQGVNTASVPSCAALKATVDEAVRSGRLVESGRTYPVPGRLR